MDMVEVEDEDHVPPPGPQNKPRYAQKKHAQGGVVADYIHHIHLTANIMVEYNGGYSHRCELHLIQTLTETFIGDPRGEMP